jgi:hypothetical protein
VSGHSLATPRQAEADLARFFLNAAPARIMVSEEVAFKAGGWLDLGELSLHVAMREKAELLGGLRQGSFEWHVPTIEAVKAALIDLFGFATYKDVQRKTAEERLPALFNNMAAIAVRTGLARPRFDANALAEMPFRHPTTIVADTSGILQGAMGFIADHLHPMARLKIPAVLHMEVINQADRFLKTRRSKGARGEIMLGEHLLSQTGQRTLLRLELREDTEVERNLLISDPLRSAFKEDRDPDLRDLNLSVPLRSYVDRMILETALQHQSYASPGHTVRLLTADQGLAKMALAEGIKPLFFKATSADQFFGRTLSGSLLHPFTGKLIGHSLTSVLWELATAFGRVKLHRPATGEMFEVVAIDRNLGWSSFHSDGDLLWIRHDALPSWPATAEAANGLTLEMIEEPDPAVPNETNKPTAVVPAKESARGRPPRARPAKAKPAASAGRKSRLGPTNKAGEAFYRLKPNDLVTLTDRLSIAQRLSLEQVMETLATKHPTSVSEYRRFFESAQLITSEGNDWLATDALVDLAAAQRELDLTRMSSILESAPSYRVFSSLIEAAPKSTPLELPMPARVQPTYQALGELTGLVAAIPGEGLYRTTTRPSLSEFAAIALQRYFDLDPEDGWVSTGEWLEALVREDAIHPTIARDALQEADAAGLLIRSTEGSTTDTRHDDHSLRVLRVKDGKPIVETVHLYRGDFLIPSKGSSSLRLQEGKR